MKVNHCHVQLELVRKQTVFGMLCDVYFAAHTNLH